MSERYRAIGLRLDDRIAPTGLALRGGELTMLIGPNGAGKTSLLRCAAGIAGTHERIAIDDADLDRMAPSRRSRALSFLGTSRDTHWPLNAKDYVALGLVGRGDLEPVEAALAEAHAERFADRRLDRLSTGERSRVMLARALVAEPSVLLLDEPCSNLDPYWQVTLVETLRRRARAGAAVLMSVHDLDLALAHADRLIVMDAGAIVADDAPDKAGSRERIASVFNVERGDTGWQPAMSGN